MVTRVPTRMITTTGVQAGSYTAADITVNEAGQITSAASNSVVVSGGGGGPKISSIAVTDSSWTVLDDTAVDVLGGYIKITGSGFSSGCLVYINQTLATATTYISSTEVRAQLPATAAGTYALYLVNTDGGVGIRLPGVTFSASPSWQTSSTLSELYDGVAITLSLVAQEATSYTLVSGSLPPGLSLNTSTGAITGTIVGVTADTTYSFIVRATDAQNQDSPRTFTVNVAVSDAYFKLTTLLLSGSALSTNTVLRDSSTNNFNLTAYGDTRASNFSPYGTGWSAYFDGTTDFVSTPTGQTNLTLGTSDFTIEGWFYIGTQVQTDPALFTSDPAIGLANTIMVQFGSSTLKAPLFVNNVHLTASSTNNYVVPNQWNHVAVCRTGGSTYSYYINGVAVDNVASNSTSLTTNSWRVGYWTVGGNAFTGYISNFRIIKGTALYSGATITVPTAPLTAVANTQLLILQSNSFIDSSTNNFAITRNGDVAIRSFNPFGITNTGVNGSMYFDGTGDYVTAPSNAAFAVGSVFTIEFWLYPISYGANPVFIFLGESSGDIQFGLNAGNLAVAASGVAWVLTGSKGPVINTWNHCVLVRSGTGTNQTSIFLNGERIANGTVTNAWTTNVQAIIQSTSGTSYLTTGYMSEVRIVKNTAVYDPTQTTITVPTQPLANITNTSLLTLQYKQSHNNHAFLDSSSNQFLLTRYGNTTQGSFSPFSPAGYSYYLDGGDQFSSPSTANLNLNLYNNWTVEGWFYRTGTFGVNDNVLSLGTKRSAVWWSFYVGTSGGGAAVGFGTGSWAFATGPTGPSSGINLNQWHHVAFVRNGASTLLIFIDGILQYTNTSYNFGSATQGGTLYIGSYVNDADNVGAYYSGYISNLRIVNGQSLYTTNFTPSTSVLTTTSQGAIASNVALLTAQSNRFIDVSLSARALTMSGDAKVAAFAPFVPTAVYNPVTHGSSAYFDGSGDYLEMTYNPAFRFAASQDFCVEFWAYATSSLTTNYILSQVATNNWGFIFGVGSVTSGRMGVYYGNGASNSVQYLDDTAAFPLYQWIHVAWCRTSGTMSLFVDGTRRSTVANTNAINLTSDRGIRVGAHQDGAASTFWPGYIAGLRSIVGNSPYNATLTTLTLPTAPPTPTTNTQILLNFADSAILDSTGRNLIETVADAKSSSVVTKFTGASMLFDGTGDNLVVPSSTLMEFGLGNFTVEFWFYKTANGSIGDSLGELLIRIGDTAATVNSLIISTNNSQQIGGYIAYSGGVWTTSIISSNTFALNTWHHVAFVRTGTGSNQTILYVNGVNVGTGTSSTNLTAASYGTQTRIGSSASDRNFNGYIQDLRVTRYARYTSNFTPPTGPHRLK